MKHDTNFTISCECGSEKLHIEQQDEHIYTDGLYISIWTLQYDRKTFWHRFKHIWHILRYGTPYSDQICLNYDAVKILYYWLQEYIVLADAEFKQIKAENAKKDSFANKN